MESLIIVICIIMMVLLAGFCIFTTNKQKHKTSAVTETATTEIQKPPVELESMTLPPCYTLNPMHNLLINKVLPLLECPDMEYSLNIENIYFNMDKEVFVLCLYKEGAAFWQKFSTDGKPLTAISIDEFRHLVKNNPSYYKTCQEFIINEDKTITVSYE